MSSAAETSVDLHAFARTCFDEFIVELKAYGLEVDPRMELRRGEGLLCYYDLSDGHVYVSLPDLEDPAGRFHMFVMASLMGCETDEETLQFFKIFIPHLIAHELAHHLRHRYGRFTKDAWLEEQIANTLAVAMCRPRLTAELLAFSRRIVPPAIKTITDQIGTDTLALDTYRDLAQAWNVAGYISNDTLADIDLARAVRGGDADVLIAALPDLPTELRERLAKRRELIASVSIEFAAGPEFVRYVYFHLAWSLIGLIGQEGHYVEMFSRDDLGLAPGESERIALLEQFAALSTLSREAIATLARTACLHRAAAGSLIAREGDRNDDVFFLIDGRIDQVGNHHTQPLAPGSMFGEDAFNLRRTRTISYRAATPSTCLAIRSADLRAAGWTPPALLTVDTQR